MKINTNETITKKFLSSFRWNIFGSCFYEISKISHQIFLLKVIESSSYGLIGSIFSIIYLAVYLGEFGFGHTLPPFLNIFIQSKQNFKKLFLKLYIFPQILLIMITAAITTYFYSISYLNNQQSPYLILIPIIIFTESIRIFCRRFSHTVFLSQLTITMESVMIFIFLSIIWIPYLFFNIRITPTLVFFSYALDSILGTITFIFIIKNFYKTLPNKKLSFPSDLWPRIFKTRFFNYSIQASKNFFTGNFLTPFFASQFGLSQAGIFNLANHIAESIKAIMKATIIFSGNALLAKLKTTTMKLKKQAFDLLGTKLNIVIYPIIIFLLINQKTLLNLKGTANLSQYTLSLVLLFLLITFMEYFFMIYEQFYVIEEKAGKLFLFKVLEMTLFYSFVILNNFPTPLMTLVIIIIIRTLIFLIIATNAYSIWKIKPNFKIKYKYLIYYIIFSLIFYFLFNFIL